MHRELEGGASRHNSGRQRRSVGLRRKQSRSVLLGERKSKFGKDGKNNSQHFTHLSYTCKAVSVTLNILLHVMH